MKTKTKKRAEAGEAIKAWAIYGHDRRQRPNFITTFPDAARFYRSRCMTFRVIEGYFTPIKRKASK